MKITIEDEFINQKLIIERNTINLEVMVAMLSGSAHEELVKAHADWKDAVDGKPKWGKACTK